MLWRILGIFLNPFVFLGWTVFKWLGRSIDGRFGPVLGWYVALLLCLVTGPSVLTSSYYAAMPVGRLVGVVEPIQAATVPGRVVLAETIEEKKWTVKERVVVRFERNGQSFTFEERLSQAKSLAHNTGDTVTVYLQDGKPASIEDPNDPIVDALSAIVGVVIPLAIFLLCLKYLFHRKRIYDELRQRPAPQPIRQSARPIPPPQPGPLTDRVLSTQERMKADEERIRLMTARKPTK